MLAYIGGLVRSFLAPLAMFGGWRLDENIFVSLFWWLDACSLGLLLWRRPVGLAWRLAGRAWVAFPPFVAILIAPAFVFFDFLDVLEGALACDIDRGVFDGSKGHEVLLLHPA